MAPSERRTREAVAARHIAVGAGLDNTYVVLVNSGQAKRYLASRGATFAPGKGGHLIVTLNGRRSVLPQHGGSKELGKGLWLSILTQLDLQEK